MFPGFGGGLAPAAPVFQAEHVEEPVVAFFIGRTVERYVLPQPSVYVSSHVPHGARDLVLVDPFHKRRGQPGIPVRHHVHKPAQADFADDVRIACVQLGELVYQRPHLGVLLLRGREDLVEHEHPRAGVEAVEPGLGEAFDDLLHVLQAVHPHVLPDLAGLFGPSSRGQPGADVAEPLRWTSDDHVECHGGAGGLPLLGGVDHVEPPVALLQDRRHPVHVPLVLRLRVDVRLPGGGDVPVVVHVQEEDQRTVDADGFGAVCDQYPGLLLDGDLLVMMEAGDLVHGVVEVGYEISSDLAAGYAEVVQYDTHLNPGAPVADPLPDLVEGEASDAFHDASEVRGPMAEIRPVHLGEQVLVGPVLEEPVVVGEYLPHMLDTEGLVGKGEGHELKIVPDLGQVPDLEPVHEGYALLVQGGPDGVGDRGRGGQDDGAIVAVGRVYQIHYVLRDLPVVADLEYLPDGIIRAAVKHVHVDEVVRDEMLVEVVEEVYPDDGDIPWTGIEDGALGRVEP